MNKRLRELRKDILNLTQKEFGDKIGLSATGLGEIEKGRNSFSERYIKLICQTFNINEEWLRNGEEPIFNEENEEKNIIDTLKKQGVKPMVLEIIENYLEMSDTSKEIFDEYLKKLISKENNNINPKEVNNIIPLEEATITEEELSVTLENNMIDLQDIKIYDTPISAVKGSFINDYEPFDIIKVNLKTCPQARRCDFALKVRGDSMEPYYYDGDIVFVKEQPSLDNGQIGIFIYEDEAYIKKYSLQEDGVYLISLNKSYPPIKIDENNAFKICGLVLR